MTMEVEIAIVGGGLGGLALAVGLQDRGIQAHLFEKAPRLRKHSGTAISIANNGIRALEGIKPGLSSKIQREDGGVTTIRRIFQRQGQPEKVTTKREAPGNRFMIPWKLAQQMLREELADPTVVHYRHTFVDYVPFEGGVEAHFEVQEEQGDSGPSSIGKRVVKAKLLVGADGVWSQVRKSIVGDEPRDLSMITWNAIVRTDTTRSLNLHEKNEIKFTDYADKLLTIFEIDCGSGYMLWQVRGPDESGEISKAYASDLEAHGRDVRKVRALKLIEGIEELHSLRVAMEATDPDAVRESRAHDRVPLTSWLDSSGRALLIADAAHGMFPGPAEGAQTAFEDAHQLSILLHEAFSSSNPDVALIDALKRFEKIRIPRCTRIQNFAAETTRISKFVPEWVQNLSPEEKIRRFVEFSAWTRQYPESMTGDPEKTYWKPILEHNITHQGKHVQRDSEILTSSGNLSTEF